MGPLLPFDSFVPIHAVSGSMFSSHTGHLFYKWLYKQGGEKSQYFQSNYMVLLLCFLFQFQNSQRIKNKHSWGFFSLGEEGDTGFSVFEGDSGFSKQHSLEEAGVLWQVQAWKTQDLTSCLGSNLCKWHCFAQVVWTVWTAVAWLVMPTSLVCKSWKCSINHHNASISYYCYDFFITSKGKKNAGSYNYEF